MSYCPEAIARCSHARSRMVSAGGRRRAAFCGGPPILLTCQAWLDVSPFCHSCLHSAEVCLRRRLLVFSMPALSLAEQLADSHTPWAYAEVLAIPSYLLCLVGLWSSPLFYGTVMPLGDHGQHDRRRRPSSIPSWAEFCKSHRSGSAAFRVAVTGAIHVCARGICERTHGV